VINVAGSDTPVFVKDNDSKEIFVVRASASTLPLDTHDAHEYIKTHW
jgi:hypothetical protein